MFYESVSDKSKCVSILDAEHYRVDKLFHQAFFVPNDSCIYYFLLVKTKHPQNLYLEK